MGKKIPDVFSTHSAARFCRVTPMTIIRWIDEGRGLGAAVGWGLFVGLCHPFAGVVLGVALAVGTPWLVFWWWWNGEPRYRPLLRILVLGALLVLGSACAWLPVIVDYEGFGGFPHRVADEIGPGFVKLWSWLSSGGLIDQGRLPVLTALLPVVAVFGRAPWLSRWWVAAVTFATLLGMGPLLGKAGDDDLIPMVRFYGALQISLAVIAGAGAMVVVERVWRNQLREPWRPMMQAGAATLAAICAVFVVGLGLTLTTDATFVQTLFEAVSAFGTVGASTGITPELTDPARVITSIAMFVGRLGPLTLVLALAARAHAVGEVQERPGEQPPVLDHADPARLLDHEQARITGRGGEVEGSPERGEKRHPDIGDGIPGGRRRHRGRGDVLFVCEPRIAVVRMGIDQTRDNFFPFGIDDVVRRVRQYGRLAEREHFARRQNDRIHLDAGHRHGGNEAPTRDGLREIDDLGGRRGMIAPEDNFGGGPARVPAHDHDSGCIPSFRQ